MFSIRISNKYKNSNKFTDAPDYREYQNTQMCLALIPFKPQIKKTGL